MAKSKYSRLKRNFVLLKALKNASPSQRKLILKNSNDDLIRCLCDICWNICKGNCKVGDHQRKKLVHHKKAVRDFANKRGSIKSKRRKIIQSGGFLSSLLVPAISIAASLIGNLVGKQ